MTLILTTQNTLYVLAAIHVVTSLFFSLYQFLTQRFEPFRFTLAIKTLQGLSWLVFLAFYRMGPNMVLLVAYLSLIISFGLETLLLKRLFNPPSPRGHLVFIWLLTVTLLITILAVLYPHLRLQMFFLTCLILTAPIAAQLLYTFSASLLQRLVGATLSIFVSALLLMALFFPSFYTFLAPSAAAYGIGFYTALSLLQVLSSSAYLLLAREVETLSSIHRASYDSLSGALKRDIFFNKANKLFQTAVENPHPIALLLVDIDLLRSINVQFGHVAGDDIIILFADILTKSVRSDDLLGRFEGGTFIICLPNSGLEDAKVVVSRIRQFYNTSKKNTEGAMPHFTFSIGIATGFPKTTDTLDDLIRDAERTLEFCKESGGNTVVHSLLGALEQIPDQIDL